MGPSGAATCEGLGPGRVLARLGKGCLALFAGPRSISFSCALMRQRTEVCSLSICFRHPCESASERRESERALPLPFVCCGNESTHVLKYFARVHDYLVFSPLSIYLPAHAHFRVDVDGSRASQHCIVLIFSISSSVVPKAIPKAIPNMYLQTGN